MTPSTTPLLPLLLQQSLFYPVGYRKRGKDLDVSRKDPHPPRKSTILQLHCIKGKEKCLHLYKLACSIKGKVKKCWHSHWVSGKFKVGGYEFKSDLLFFFLPPFFETHYTGSVASLSKCVPSYLLLS